MNEIICKSMLSLELVESVSECTVRELNLHVTCYMYEVHTSLVNTISK